MGCNVTISGILSDCSPSKGGVLATLFVNKSDALEGIANSNYYGNFTVDSSKITSDVAKVFEPNRDTSSFTSTLNVDTTNGIKYVSTEIVLQFNRMSAAKRTELNNILKGEWVVFVEDANKQWYCFGWKDFDVTVASSGTGQTGGAKSDGNYYQVTLTCETSMFPCPTDDNSSIEALNNLVKKKSEPEPTKERLNFTSINLAADKWSDDLNIVDSNGVSVTKASDKYDIITLRVQYSSSKNYPVSFRTAKDCYLSSASYKYFSTNGFGYPTSADNYDLTVTFENGESGMPQCETKGYTGKSLLSFWDVTATNLQLSYNGSSNQISFSQAYVYEDGGQLYIVYKNA